MAESPKGMAWIQKAGILQLRNEYALAIANGQDDRADAIKKRLDELTLEHKPAPSGPKTLLTVGT